MSDRSLRGSNLGTRSMETDEGVSLAPRQVVEYICPDGHITQMPFSVEAEVPALWECRCGDEALRRDTDRPDVKPSKPARTHWDMLLERRTISELEDLLAERLTLLRSGRLTSSVKRSA